MSSFDARLRILVFFLSSFSFIMFWYAGCHLILNPFGAKFCQFTIEQTAFAGDFENQRKNSTYKQQ